MKTSIALSFAVAILLFSQTIFAQNNILFQINHRLGAENFALFQEVQTPDGHAFNLDRLEYYISEISITHDGGMITTFDSLWILVDASSATNKVLGVESIDSAESISFHIGVNQPYNHLDPSSWPSSHPLYHQNPSMHWGWSAGYRFVAMEGLGGSSLNQVFEVHALGDNNYFETTVEAAAKASNGNLRIELFADYTQALAGVNISSGVISHGSTGESITVLQNFRDYVFSNEIAGDTTDSVPETPEGITELRLDDRFKVYPNPSADGVINVTPTHLANNGTLKCIDLRGSLIQESTLGGSSSVSFSGLEPGLYILRYMEPNTGIVQVQRVVVH